MRAAIFRNGEIVVDEMAEPTPGPGQVLVKSLACGICGSDLHARKHAHRMVELAKFFPAASRWICRATSCSAMNSAARSSTTARAHSASSSPAPMSVRCPR